MDALLSTLPYLASWVAENPQRALRALIVGREALEDSAVTHIDSAVRRMEEVVGSTIAASIRHIEDVSRRLEVQQQRDIGGVHTRIEDALRRTESMTQDTLRHLETSLKETTVPHKTAVGLGEVGETMLLEAAKRVWPDAEIVDTTGTARMSDLHVVVPLAPGADWGSTRIVLEAKNKTIITAEDVRKARRDCAETAAGHADMRAYVFVSLRSAAIPGIGRVHYEFSDVDGSSGKARRIFIAWFAFDTLDEAKLDAALRIVSAMAALLSIPKPELRGDERAIEAAEAMVARCITAVETLATQKKAVEAMSHSFKALYASWMALVSSTDASYVAFDDLLRPMIEAGQLKCGRCGKLYRIKSALEKHVASCKGA